MHRRRQRIHQEASGGNSTQKSRRSYWRSGIQFTKSLQSRAQVYPYASSTENTRSESRQCTENGKNSRKCQHGKWRKSGAKKRSSRRHKEEERTVPLRCTHGHLSSQEFIIGTTISKVQRPGGNSERRFRLLRSIHRARFVCITNDGRKSYGWDCGTTRMCRKSSRRSISVYLGQNGRCTSSIENS